MLMVLVLVGLQIWDPPLVQALRLKVFDQMMRWHPRQAQEVSPVVVVDIDDDSLRRIGQWPWPRNTIAHLVDRLSEAGVVAVAFDLLLVEPDRLSPGRLAESIEGLDAATAETLQRLPDNDARLAESLRQHRVVMGETVSSEAAGPGSPPARNFLTVAQIGGDPRAHIESFPGSIRSIPVLEEAASGSGLVTVTPELDGIVRRVPLIANLGGRIVPTLSLELLRVATGQRTLVVRSNERGIDGVVVQGVSIPTDASGRVFVNFARRRDQLYIPAADVLDGAVGPERLRGRLVIIGTSAAGLGDIKSTPIDGNMPGVEVHAQLLETILVNDYLQRTKKSIGAERLYLAGFGILLAIVGPGLPAALMPPILLFSIVGTWAVSWLALEHSGILLDPAYPTVGVAALVLWLALARYVREQNRRREVRNAFSLYLSPAMVDQLSRNRKLVRLGGERRVLTVLFSDVRDFTSLSERYTNNPEGLTRLLNRYFTEMTAAILAHGGTIDKYIGDAIMAFWNAPLELEGHERAACLAALEMRHRLRTLNSTLGDEHAARGLPFWPIELGIGINSGPCFVGNLGSAQRFNYSVLGDTVNVAARLESETKSLGFSTVIGETTFDASADLAALRLDTLWLKGKSVPTKLYALVGDAELARRPAFAQLREQHDRMLASLDEGDLQAAERHLAACMTAESHFGLGSYLHRRAARIEALRHGRKADETGATSAAAE